MTPTKALNFTPENHRKSREGLKTQTRRVVSPQPPLDEGGYPYYDRLACGLFCPTAVDSRGEEKPGTERYGAYSGDGVWSCASRYQPGDIVALRTSWAVNSEFDGIKPSNLPKTCLSLRLWFASDGSKPGLIGKTRPAMFLPKHMWSICPHARIVDVRVERVQEISHRDALAEGVDYDVSKHDGAPLARFQYLWDSINAKRAPWGSNPWVWVYEYEMESQRGLL